MAASECTCVKWHAPPTRRYYLGPGGEKVCLVSGQQALDLADKYRAKGRITKVAGTGYTAYQKALAETLFTNNWTMVMEDPPADVPDAPEPEPEPEPAPEPQPEPAPADA
jgi:hypothetical protein